MNRKQLMSGLIVIGVGFVLMVVSAELQGIKNWNMGDIDITDEGGIWINTSSLVFRILSYIAIIVGVIVLIMSFVPEDKNKYSKPKMEKE